MIQGVRRVEGGKPNVGSETHRLIASYLEKKLHCRRTLDQYCYHMLSPEDMDWRNETQVMFRFANRSRRVAEKGEAPILMVDQLWLYIMSDGKESKIKRTVL